MTTEHVRDVAEIAQADGTVLYQGTCSCGTWTQPTPTANKGAAAFAASAHAKKANGLPVFAPKGAPKSKPASAAPQSLEGAVALLREQLQAEDVGYVLPATRRRVVSSEYTVSNYRTFPGRYEGDGSAFTAHLRRRGQIIATVSYFGDGGETQVEWADADRSTYPGRYFVTEDGAIVDKEPGATAVVIPFEDGSWYASSKEEAEFLRWCRKLPGRWVEGDGSDSLDGTPLEWTPTGAVEVLTAEAETLKRLNGTRTTVPVLSAKQASAPNGVEEWGTIGARGRKQTVEGAAAYCLRTPTLGESSFVWYDGAWRPVGQFIKTRI